MSLNLAKQLLPHFKEGEKVTELETNRICLQFIGLIPLTEHASVARPSCLLISIFADKGKE